MSSEKDEHPISIEMTEVSVSPEENKETEQAIAVVAEVDQKDATVDAEKKPSDVPNATPSNNEPNPEDDIEKNDKKTNPKTNLDRSKFLGEGPLLSTIWTLTYPDLIGKVISASYTFADAVYIGNLAGETQEEKALALGSVSFAMPIEQAFQNGLALLYATGLSTALSKYLGQSNSKMAEVALGNMYFLDIAGGILYPMIILPFINYILMALGASEEAGTLSIAYTYIIIITLGAMFSNFSFGNNNMIRAEGQAIWSAMIKVVGGAFNILMDPVFISVFGLGVNGAALCTVVSNMLVSILGILYYVCKKSVVALTCAGMKPNWPVIKNGLNIGLSGCLLTVSSSIVTLVFNSLVVKFSPHDPASIETTELVSVVGALSKVTYLVFLPMLAISHGVLPILSYCKGAKKYDRFKECLKVCFYCSVYLGAGLALLSYFLAPYIGRMFSTSPTFIDTFTIALRYQTSALPFAAFFFMALPALQASGAGMLASFLAILRNCLFLIIVAIVFDYARNDYWGFTIAYPVAEFFSSIICVLILYFDRKKIMGQNE